MPKMTVRRPNSVLVDFLADRLNLSKKKAKALLDARAVLVNGRRVWMAQHSLSPGDKVEAAVAEVPGHVEKATLRTLFENHDYLVIDKPPGILSNGAHSVEAQLRADLNRPELCAAHRLDRDTTGCLLIAGTRTAFDAVVALFRKRRVMKQYHAIVHGNFRAADQNITSPLEGQRAITTVKRLDCNSEASHLLIRIETGRTHQIRKHLSALGHPVLGDRQYGLRVSTSARARRLPRHMLHASNLQFTSPVDGSRVRAKSPLPRDFRRCLQEMRLT